MLTSSLAPVIESRFFGETSVGLGEELFGGIEYNLAHNQKNFFLLKMRRAITPTETVMFHKTLPLALPTYKPPTPSRTASEISEQFLLASVGKNDKSFLDSLQGAGIRKLVIPDPDRVWTNFVNLQLFSPEVNLSRDHVLSVVSPLPSPFLREGSVTPSR